MLAERRRREILALVSKNGEVEIQELAAIYSVSLMTIRRDLEVLSSEGLLKRTHGGAVPNNGFVELPIDAKRRSHPQEKEGISLLACQFIEPGMSLILDAGTTTLLLSRHLQDLAPLRVITTDLEIAKTLSDYPEIEVFVTGGLVKAGVYSVDGHFAIEILSTIHADLAFIGCDSFSADSAMSRSVNKVALKQAMMQSAQMNILLADASKCGHTSFLEIAPLDHFHAVITDSSLPVTEKASIRERGIHLSVAGERP
jgi:DeoR/GlpR family transcriptional regulator of sugar metabolism